MDEVDATPFADSLSLRSPWQQGTDNLFQRDSGFEEFFKTEHKEENVFFKRPQPVDDNHVIQNLSTTLNEVEHGSLPPDSVDNSVFSFSFFQKERTMQKSKSTSPIRSPRSLSISTRSSTVIDDKDGEELRVPPHHMEDKGHKWNLIRPTDLEKLLKTGMEKTLLIDSRSFLEYNTSHIQQSVNVCCSKLVKRRLQRDKVHIKDLLTQTCQMDADEYSEVIVYDQCTENPSLLTEDNFLIVLLRKLETAFQKVSLLRGGLLDFQAMYPSLCESKTNTSFKCAPLTSLSQPCMPVSNIGPTRILPFLYLGSQRDALSQEIIQVNEISYILNVSTTCPKPTFIQDGHFLRIPVNDNYSAKLLPHFHEAFQFLDKVRESNGCVLVHCLAGISRSPTLAIAYIMKHLGMSSDDAYRYVKDKRPTISPNFNFLGQLLEWEKQMKHEALEKDDKNGNISSRQGDNRTWSNYVMDLQSCSPSSPGAKNIKPFNFDTKSLSLQSKFLGTKDLCSGSLTKGILSDKDSNFSQSSEPSVELAAPFPGPSCDSGSLTEISSNSQFSPFPVCMESTARSWSKKTYNQFEVQSVFRSSQSGGEHSVLSKTFTERWTVTDNREDPPCPFPCSSESTISGPTLFCPHSSDTGISQLISSTSSPLSDEMSSSQIEPVSTSQVLQSQDTDQLQNELAKPPLMWPPLCLNAGTSSILPSPLQENVLYTSSPLSFKNEFARLSTQKRPLRALSLALSPIAPESPTDSFRSMENNVTVTIATTSAASSPIAMTSSSCVSSDLTIPSANACSITTAQKIKLKSFSLSAPSSLTNVQSPTSSLAKLNFSHADSDSCTKSEATKENISFQTFPTTSLDKLNFTPCCTKIEENSYLSAGIKRPHNSSVDELKTSEPLSPVSPMTPLSITSTSSISSYNSSLASPTTVGTSKVKFRSREGRVRRTIVRPNSIAFSTYPTFDLGSDCQDSPNSGSSASQDDTSETYMLQNGKKSKQSGCMGDIKFRVGKYSEREIYRQITSAMETAMLKTQAYEASRKSRSLDDMLNSDEEGTGSSFVHYPFSKFFQQCGMAADQFSPALGCNFQGSTDPYQSTSSISSNGSHSSIHGSHSSLHGSHNSLHGSLEVIQVS
ncbi:hypothetical protein ACJMK2_029872 [Sinanodonta woodiana]|uniref:protein-tyrosine-phosphatase n=1 Tax=Sinanodonta woodiana TaxID=1069815 RepID=A0ABD3XBJ0_SINWO